MEPYENEVELMDYLNVIWKRKWLIIIPTFFLAIAAGVVSFLQPPQWEVDAIIQPSKFFTQTEAGQFEEVVIVDPKQIAGQINQETYNMLISAELNIDSREFPKLKSENLRDTKLIRVSVRDNNVTKGKDILTSLFRHLKRELDQKIDVEMKGIDTKIASAENDVKKKNIDIQSKEIDISKIKQESLSAQNKLKISEERFNNIITEMKAVKERIDAIEKQQRNALSERKEGSDAISLLLYSNEIQQNFRYYNTLDEKLSTEKITQENLMQFIREKEQEIKQLKNQIEKLHNEIDGIHNENELLEMQKNRIDYAKLVKEPTASINPVAPRKKVNVAIAGVVGLFMFTILAFFIEHVSKQQQKVAGK
ncbi:MAG: Wzz/FepE/Etk N-terminal domain-containing protein [Candidatus Aminicenantales bacterium]